MTARELRKECERLITMGLGDKNIMISQDDEGNGFHYLYYGFTTSKEDIQDFRSVLYCEDKDIDNIVLLG